MFYRQQINHLKFFHFTIKIIQKKKKRWFIVKQQIFVLVLFGNLSEQLWLRLLPTLKIIIKICIEINIENINSRCEFCYFFFQQLFRNYKCLRKSSNYDFLNMYFLKIDIDIQKYNTTRLLNKKILLTKYCKISTKSEWLKI